MNDAAKLVRLPLTGAAADRISRNRETTNLKSHSEERYASETYTSEHHMRHNPATEELGGEDWAWRLRFEDMERELRNRLWSK